MYKLALLVMMFVVVAVSIGCQEPGLSEEDVRSIVEEELEKQPTSVDRWTVSQLVIANEDGDAVALIDGKASGGTVLHFLDTDGRVVAQLSSSALFFYSDRGKLISTFGTAGLNGSSARAGYMSLYDEDGDVAFRRPE